MSTKHLGQKDTHSLVDDLDTCLVCADPLQIAALSPCNHTVCNVCAFRQRALYGKKHCLVCRTENNELIFTDNIKIQNYNDIPNSTLIEKFKGDLGIRYTSYDSKDKTLTLLNWKCPIKKCTLHNFSFDKFKELNTHVKSAHNKQYCRICGENKKAFPFELQLYDPKLLEKHIKHGDYDGFKGHPDCRFCKERFYSDDELSIHLRQKHEKCHVCDQIDSSKPKYFKNYNELERHFGDDHYICTVRSCLDQKFVVFADDFDLQAHMAKIHPEMFTNRVNFGSKLSTSNIKSKNSIQSDPKISFETKKKRLEIRAKHYLEFDDDLFEEFTASNNLFSNKKISAQQLLSAYQKLFKKGHNADISLLIYEFSELFPKNSSERLSLENINKPIIKENQMDEVFPELPGSRSSSNSKMPSLKTRKKKKEKFPSLPLNPVVPKSSWGNNGINSTINKSVTRGISNNSPINGSSIPGYNPEPVFKPAKTAKSFPSLGISSAPSSRSNSSLGINTSVVTTAKSDSKFPSLPNKKVSKISRVNPLPVGNGNWGSSSSMFSTGSAGSNSGLDELFETGLNIKIKPKKKKKKNAASVSDLLG
ncbi:E3 ubiquitin-protein ligase [Martiniozyma asiatica (nom. inval.)]|nr:E3 ubiquitin-protein ligase [Martiniozyma asiatica]